MTANADRVNAWRERLRLEGARQVTIMLPAEACRALDAMKSLDPKRGNADIIAAGLKSLARQRGVI